MDPKIMAAVFASIAALAVGTGGSGSIDNFQDVDAQQILGQISSSPGNILSQFSEKPEPENSVTTVVELNSDRSPIKIRNGDLQVNDFNELKSKSREISSDSELTFLDFNGRTVINRENGTVVSGKTRGFSSSGVSFRKSMTINFATDSSHIRAVNVSKTSIDLGDVNVSMESNEDSTVIQKDNTRLKINSFSGDISIFQENMSLVFRGDVDKLEAGGTSFTG